MPLDVAGIFPLSTTLHAIEETTTPPWVFTTDGTESYPHPSQTNPCFGLGLLLPGIRSLILQTPLECRVQLRLTGLGWHWQLACQWVLTLNCTGNELPVAPVKRRLMRHELLFSLAPLIFPRRGIIMHGNPDVAAKADAKLSLPTEPSKTEPIA